MHQNQEAISANAHPGQIEDIVDLSRVGTRFPIDHEEEHARRDNHVGWATKFNVLILGILSRRVEKHL
ncbi:hypothetical protein EG829_33895 [bacterium]|nr:hypothetical protein [bacterium]